MSNEVTTIEGEVLTLEQAQEKAAAQGYAVQLVDGSEVGDPTPVAPPIGFTEGPDLIDQIRNMVRREMALKDEEVIDDDDEDFDHPDLDEPFTRHEVEALSRDELLSELQRRGMLREKKAAPDAPGVSAAPSKPNPPAPKEGGEAGGSQKAPPAPPPGG